jgi:thiamine biosynthesis lipoprotein
MHRDDRALTSTARPASSMNSRSTSEARTSSAVWALALLALACEPEPEPEPRRREPEVEAPEPEVEETVPGDFVVRRSRSMMGTIFQITVAGMSEERADPVMRAALDEIDRLEGVLSEWREDSEVSAINRAAGNGRAIRVGEDTMRIVVTSNETSALSGGAFDLSWAALRGLYRFQPGEHHVPPLSEVRARLALVGWRDIVVDRDASTVRLAREGMALGTGGIAKGYALDRAAAVLREGGAENFMLFGGGQVLVHGRRGERPWRVGIQHPRDPAVYIGFIEATEGSIATAGDYEHAFVDERGRHWHHIIDLSTGLPSTASMQVTVLARDGLTADAVDTAAFILGPERGLEMLARAPGAPKAVIIGPDLRVHTTPGFREEVVWRVELDDRGRLPGETRFDRTQE